MQWGNSVHKKNSISIISVFVVIAIFLAIAAHYGTKTLSAIRAYVVAEGQWTKKQKQAVGQLVEYSINQDSVYYKQFQESLSLQEKFSEARKAMVAEDPEKEEALKSLISGDMHSEDANLIIWFTTNFKDMRLMQKGLDLWRQGDERLVVLDSLARSMKTVINRGELSEERRADYISKIYSVDQQLTTLETDFSDAMDEAGRMVRKYVYWAILLIGGLIVAGGYLIVRGLFSKISSLNEQLDKSEAKIKQLLQHSKSVIYQLNVRNGQYEYMSPQIEDLLGYPRQKIKDGGLAFIRSIMHPDDRERLDQETESYENGALEGNFMDEMEMRVKRADGKYIWINNQRSLIRNSDGEPVAIVGSVHDVTDQKKEQEFTKQSLNEKKTLLEEIHHRIKNNLAVISSIIELQKQESEEENGVLDDIQSRINSVAKIHEKLYQTDGFSKVDMKEYIEDFSDMILNTYKSKRDVEVHKKLESFQLDIDDAVSAGLIFNELFNNVFKHGLSNDKKPEIIIELEANDGYAKLGIADNGNGLPYEFDMDESKSLGMTLVKTLTMQLEGELEISQNGWTKFEVTFPIS